MDTGLVAWAVVEYLKQCLLYRLPGSRESERPELGTLTWKDEVLRVICLEESEF